MAFTKYEIGASYTLGAKTGPPTSVRNVSAELPLDASIDQIIAAIRAVYALLQPIEIASIVKREEVGFLFLSALRVFADPV